jgi:hypothetical protein
MSRNFNDALAGLEAALSDTPDDVWETDLWPDEAPTGPAPGGGLVGSAPWFLAYHALSVLDYDLSGGFEPWEPPKPFDENVWSLPARVFSRTELLGYVAYCRDRVELTLTALSDDAAARPIPAGHRYQGTLFGVLVGTLPMHVTEHGSQIRQWLAAAGVKVQPLPGDRHYKGQ